MVGPLSTSMSMARFEEDAGALSERDQLLAHKLRTHVIQMCWINSTAAHSYSIFTPLVPRFQEVVALFSTASSQRSHYSAAPNLHIDPILFSTKLYLHVIMRTFLPSTLLLVISFGAINAIQAKRLDASDAEAEKPAFVVVFCKPPCLCLPLKD